MALFDSLASDFNKDTPVLRLTFGKDSTAKWVLWPVFAWRVVAPIPKERKLNLFQRAVLGFARAGVVRALDVADRMLISFDLAGLVVSELQNMGFIDHTGQPTSRGLKALAEVDEEPPDEARVGHVFSDPFSGKLWPRFLAGDLPVADVDLNESGWPVLLSGSAGDPWKDRTFCLLPGGGDALIAGRPNAKDILNAARRHRRQRNFDEVDDDRDVPRLQRVSFVDDQPHPYFFALRVRRDNFGDWLVDDPFGHGESVGLRAQLEERLDIHKGLRAWLAPLVGADPLAPTLSQYQTEASWRVEERLTLGIRQHEILYERLVAMHRAKLEAEEDTAPRDKWEDVLVKAQKALERTLHLVQLPYLEKETRLYNDLAERDKAFNQRYLNALAEDLGFQTPLPERLTAVRRGKIQYAEGMMKGGLQPILLVALLWAKLDIDHPLRVAATRQPDLLHRIHELASARDSGAHDGPEVWPKTVPNHVETVYITVECLLSFRNLERGA